MYFLSQLGPCQFDTHPSTDLEPEQPFGNVGGLLNRARAESRNQHLRGHLVGALKFPNAGDGSHRLTIRRCESLSRELANRGFAVLWRHRLEVCETDGMHQRRLPLKRLCRLLAL